MSCRPSVIRCSIRLMNPLRLGRPVRGLVVICASSAMLACSERSPAGPADRPTPNFIRLQSDVGDYIGAGQNYEYTQANAILSVAGTGGRLSVRVNGDQAWGGDFMSPTANPFLQPGKYEGLARYPFNDPAKGGLDWFGEGRGCNTLSGSFTVDSVTYAGNDLTAMDLRFEQHCEGATAALNVTIHWWSEDPTVPPGPVNPPPAGLWQPAPGSTPSSGNYVYLNSDVGDYIGLGQTYTYTPATATIAVTATGGHLAVSVSGAQGWSGDFQAMSTLGQLQRGYYADLRRYPFHNPAKGGLDWFGEGRGCNTLLGWFAIDGIAYTNGSITALDLRFEQHCEGGAAALHGAIHWSG